MLNKIVLMGRLVKDPELRTTGSGTSVSAYTIAVERDRADVSGARHADFVDCISWRAQAEFVNKYFRKGSMIIVDGRLESRDWVDKNDNKRKSWEVITENVYFGETKKVDTSTPVNAFVEMPDDGELPF